MKLTVNTGLVADTASNPDYCRRMLTLVEGVLVLAEDGSVSLEIDLSSLTSQINEALEG